MTKKLNIFLAGPRGFCAGVDRAIEMVKGALKKYGSGNRSKFNWERV